MALEMRLMLRLSPHLKTAHFQIQLCIMGYLLLFVLLVSRAPGDIFVERKLQNLKNREIHFLPSSVGDEGPKTKVIST